MCCAMAGLLLLGVCVGAPRVKRTMQTNGLGDMKRRKRRKRKRSGEASDSVRVREQRRQQTSVCVGAF